MEDIVDTGLTMLKILGALGELGPQSVTVATLLDKVSRRNLAAAPAAIPFPPRLGSAPDPDASEGANGSAMERKLQTYLKYVGFVCPNEFVVGYGLDFNELYRTLPYIGVLKPELYQ